MAEASSGAARAKALAKTIATFLAAWVGILWLISHPLAPNRLERTLGAAARDALGGSRFVKIWVEALFEDTLTLCGVAFFSTLVAATALAIGGAILRMIVRTRVRAKMADSLDPLRAWTRAHPKATTAILALPSLAWMYYVLIMEAFPGLDIAPSPYTRLAPGVVLSAWGVFAMARKGLRELTAPTLGGTEEMAREIAQDEIVFDAVAVTPQTLAIVALFSSVMLGVPALILWQVTGGAERGAPPPHGSSEWELAAMGAYAAFAAVGAYGFRKASRISVGVDGVHIRGTSRAQFFAYRDLDGARTDGTDIVLSRRGKTVLRLQLHGEDAARQGAILARITENVARAKEAPGAVAAHIVAASTMDDLARAAAGAGDYRVTNLTREQLWSLVELPETAGDVRQAAAAALAKTADDSERTRLRVAAELCAEPIVRVALHDLVADEPEFPPVAARTARS